VRRKPHPSGAILPILWLVVICLAFGNLQAHHVSAYQQDESTPEPTQEATLEPSATPTPEEDIQPMGTNTVEATLTSEIMVTETATELPSNTPVPSAVPENLVTLTPEARLQIATLSGEYASDEVLIRFRKSASNETILQCLSASNATLLSTIEEISVWVVQVPVGSIAESIAVISACPEVRYAEPNYIAFAANTIPSDPNWTWQYGLVNIRAPQGWDYSTGSTAVTIAIIDSGVDLNHADLAAKIVPGYDFVNNDNIPQDDFGHGTRVAGIAAASSNNGIGVAGVSWGARIMPVKVLNSGGFGFFDDIADGITWAADHGAQVINLSLGSSSTSQTLQDAVNYAYGKGVVLVAASGNSTTSVLYPALYPNVIAVGAVDSANNRTKTSNFGAELDLVAPGYLIYTTTIGGYGYDSGTSMSAPYVSGLAAVLRGMPGNTSPALITSEMQSSAADLGVPGFDIYYGFGLIQMDSALRLVLPPTTIPTPTIIPTLTTIPTPTKFPAPADNRNQFSVPGVPAFIIPSVTNTNVPLASPTATTTITFLPPTTTTEPMSSAPPKAQITLTQQVAQAQSSFPAWQLPCAGLAFLFAGILLLWTARQKR